MTRQKERALLGYVEQMAHGGNVDDPAFAALAKFFTPQEIVEITYRSAATTPTAC